MENNTNPQIATTPATFAPLTLKAIFEDKIFDAKQLRQPHWMKDGRRFCFLDILPNTEIVTVWMYDVEKGERTPLIFADTLQQARKANTSQEAIATQQEASHKERNQQAASQQTEARQQEANQQGSNQQEASAGQDGKTDKGKEDALVIHGYQWSPDETRLLLARLPRSHDAEGDKALYIYTPAAQYLECIAQTEQEYRNVKWSPDGRCLGCVKADDLYLLDLETKIETRLTDTATPSLYNGRFGWVYQEELDLVDGWAWSPDGNWIAYCECDESAVPLLPLTRYETLHLEPELQRYPKAGDPNPVVRVGCINVGNRINHGEHGGQGEEKEKRRKGEEEKEEQGTEEMQSAINNQQSAMPSSFILHPSSFDYLAGFQWTPDNQLLVQHIPRLQNTLNLLRCDPATGESALLLTETDTAWVDARGKIVFVGETGEWLWPSDRDGYNHLYLYDRDGALLRQVTDGAWDVEALLGVDAQHRTAFFSAARHNVYQRELWAVSLDRSEPTQLSEATGFHRALFAPNGKLYLNTVSTRAAPPHTDLRQADGSLIAQILDNPLPQLEAYRAGMGQWEFTSFQTADGITLNAMLLRPPDFDPSRKYPVLMYTYGGPNSQVVLDTWGSRVGLEQLLAQQGYILALVDGRGSGMRGREFKKCTYLNLGKYEVEDQIAGAKWLAGLPYVDEERIGIWGWSYGGYMTCLCLLHIADVFKAGVAVAPVTDWKLYDSIYTERYMRRPEDNPDGYLQAAPLTHAEQLKGRFLLMHGLDDDNVHFQNAAQLAALWQKRNKSFQMMAYPGKHHGLEDVAPHWSQMFTNFLLANL